MGMSLRPKAPHSSSLAAAVENHVFDKTRMCTFNLRGRCKKGSLCTFAHSQDEVLPQPDFFKTQLCIQFFRSGRCPRGTRCTFAHNNSELRNSTKNPKKKELEDHVRKMDIQIESGDDPDHSGSSSGEPLPVGLKASSPCRDLDLPRLSPSAASEPCREPFGRHLDSSASTEAGCISSNDSPMELVVKNCFYHVQVAGPLPSKYRSSSAPPALRFQQQRLVAEKRPEPHAMRPEQSMRRRPESQPLQEKQLQQHESDMQQQQHLLQLKQQELRRQPRMLNFGPDQLQEEVEKESKEKERLSHSQWQVEMEEYDENCQQQQQQRLQQKHQEEQLQMQLRLKQQLQDKLMNIHLDMPSRSAEAQQQQQQQQQQVQHLQQQQLRCQFQKQQWRRQQQQQQQQQQQHYEEHEQIRLQADWQGQTCSF
mmetsp:Transcript_59195/g.125463  ORF Transcript_59195/g.125463 Transcript_59195/m.125463 type:complete len:423 (-) Transcript_59195:477-1745(-)